MKRRLLNVNKDQTVVNYLRPYEGGTGGKSQLDARLVLDIAPSSTAGSSLGVALLPPSGLTPLHFDGVGYADHGVSLKGPTTIAAGIQTSYQITDYDMGLEYTVTANNAVVRREHDTVMLTPLDMVDSVLLNINGRLFSINVQAARPKAPVIISPISNSPSITTSFTAVIGAYEGGDATDTHLSTQWEVSTDMGFSSVVTYSHDNPSHKLAWVISGLSLNTHYCLRSRVKGSKYGYSAWSITTYFKTKTTSAAVSENAKLALTDAAFNDRMGESLAMSADGATCVVGIPGRYSARGQVVVYKKRGYTWVYHSSLHALDGSAGDRFGSTVSITADDSTIVVGSPSDNNNTGSAYLFVKKEDSYVFTQRLTAPDATEGDYFSSNVCISADGKYLALAAPRKNAATGMVYFYEINALGASLVQKLEAVSGFSGALFGHMVSMSADASRIAIASPGDKDKGVNAGACHIYTRDANNFKLETKLLDNSGAAHDFMSYSISMSGDGASIMLGAYQDDDRGTNSGSVIYYTRVGTSWSQRTRLLANDAYASDLFGYSVSMSQDGNVVIVGAYGDNPQGTMSGSCYVFKRSGITWNLQAKVFPSDCMQGDRFGSSCSISADGTYSAIGAPSSDSGAESTGSVYIFV